MATDDHVSNKDLYQEIMKLHEKMDTIITTRISPLERSMDRIYVYIGIIGVLSSAVITLIVTYLKEKILNI